MRNVHQADHVIRAFRYQLLQSIVAWLDLRDGEVLWIEVTEDFSVDTREGSHSVQVKHSDAISGPRPVSLRTQEVRDTILRFWEDRLRPGSAACQLTFIARSGASRERHSPLPGRITGIEYWERVSVGGSGEAMAPLRELLMDIFRGTSIGAWLAVRPSDDDLRQRLLTRVQFLINSKDDAALEALLTDRLGALYLSKRHMASTGSTGLALLIDHVFKTGSFPRPEARRLTIVDLHSTLEKAIPRLGAYEQLKWMAVQNELPADTEIAISEVSVRSDLIDREQLVDRLVLDTKCAPIIWLTGSNGVGKSTLATLISRSRGGRWLHCDIRLFLQGGRDQAVLAAWRELMSALNRSGPVSGIILDDIPVTAADLLKVRIVGLATMLQQQGAGQLIITSNHRPSGVLCASLGLAPEAVIDVPYFTVEEIVQLISQDRPPEAHLIKSWGALVHVTTQGGHPLLALSKISNLRQLGWPTHALREDIAGKPNAGIAEARGEARRRLLSDLTTSAQRELLARVSVVFNVFDEPLAKLLGHQSDAIDNPGDALIAMKGSWIEVLSAGYLRLSPIIADLQGDVPPQSALRWRRVAAEYWMSGGVLNEQTIPLVFWNAFLGKHPWVLFKVSELILPLSPELLRAIGGVLSPLAFMRTDIAIWDDPILGSMLRLIQIRAADAIESESLATDAARAWLREIEVVEPILVRRLMILTAPPHFFQLGSVRLPATEQLEIVDRMRATIKEGAVDGQEVRDAIDRMASVLPEGSSLDSFFISQGLMQVRSSNEFEQMVNALNLYPSQVRNQWLDGATAILEGAGVWIHNAWSAEQLGHKDLGVALECYSRMADTVATWERPDLEAEFVVAQSILLHEGLGESERACAIVRAGMERLGRRVVLLRQLSKLLSAQGETEAAAQVFRESEPDLASLFNYDQVLAFRDGGVAYAEAGQFSDAFRAYTRAYDVLENSGRNEPLQAALLIEKGLVELRRGRRGDAIDLVARSLEILERGDPNSTRQGRRALSAAHALAISTGKGMRMLIDSKAGELSHGFASQPELSDPPTSTSKLCVATTWQLLEIAEAEIEGDRGISKRIEGRLSSADVKPELRLQLLRARFSAAVNAGDVKKAYDRLGPLLDHAMMITSGSDHARVEMGRAALVDMILAYALRSAWTDETAERLVSSVPLEWCPKEILIEYVNATRADAIDHQASGALFYCSLVGALLQNSDLLPLDRFVGDLYLVQTTLVSNARNALEPLVIEWLISGWHRVVETQGVHLRNPRMAVPAIKRALELVREEGLREAITLFPVLAESVGAIVPSSVMNRFERAFGNRADS